jgi:hypothetical protein
MVRPCSVSCKLNCGIAVIGIDIGKNSFHVVGLDLSGKMSSQNIPLKGRIDFQGSSRILATETNRV